MGCQGQVGVPFFGCCDKKSTCLEPANAISSYTLTINVPFTLPPTGSNPFNLFPTVSGGQTQDPAQRAYLKPGNWQWNFSYVGGGAVNNEISDQIAAALTPAYASANGIHLLDIPSITDGTPVPGVAKSGTYIIHCLGLNPGDVHAYNPVSPNFLYRRGSQVAPFTGGPRVYTFTSSLLSPPP